MNNGRGESAPSDDKNSDLRYTARDNGQIRVERQLDASGRLARGDHTHMHTLNFSAKAQRRTKEKVAPLDESTAAVVHPQLNGTEAPAGADESPPRVGPIGRMISRIFGDKPG